MQLGKSIRSRRAILVPAALAGLVSVGQRALAATYTWDGGGANNNWSASANWTGDIVATSNSASEIVLDGTTRLSPAVDVSNPWILNSLTYATGAGAFSLTGNSLQFAGTNPALVNNSNSNQTIANAINLAAATTFRGTGTGTVTFSSAFTGTGALTIDSGSFQLNAGSPSYAQTVTVNAGAKLTSQAQVDATYNPFGTGALHLNSGTVSLIGRNANNDDPNAALGSTTFAGGSTIQIDNVGGGNATTTVTAAALGRAAGSKGTLIINDDGALSGVEKIKVTAALTPTNGMVNAYYVRVNGAGITGDFVTYGSNGFAVSTYTTSMPANSSPSNTIISPTASVAVTAPRDIHALRTANNVTGTSTLTLRSGGLIINETLSVSPTLIFGQSATPAEGLVFTASGKTGTINAWTGSDLTKFGDGTLVLQGAGTVTGATTVNSGTLRLASTGSLGNTAIAALTNTTFQVNTSAGGSVNAGTTVAGSAGATLNLAKGATFDMTDSNVGTFNLQQQASFSTATTALTLSGATLKFNLSSSGADKIAINRGAASVTGSNTIDITTVGSSLTVGGSYDVITASSGLNTGFALQSSRVTAGSNIYRLSMAGSTASAQKITVAGVVPIYDLAVAPASSSIIVGGSTAVTSTVTNRNVTGADALNYSGLAVTASGGTISGSSASGSNITTGNSAQNIGQSFSAATAGTYTLTPTGSATDAADGLAATAGTVTPASVTVLNHASGSATGTTIALPASLAGYVGTLNGLTSASVSNAAGSRVNLKTLGTTAAGFVSINNVTGVVAGGSAQSISASASLTGSQTAGAGALNQSFALNYADDSSLSGALSTGLGGTTINVTGDVYNHASGSATGTTIALPDSMVGYTGTLNGLTSAQISNATGFRVNLKTVGSTSAGFVSINNVTAAVAGGPAKTISASAVVNGTQNVGVGSLNQSFNLDFADDSSLAGAQSSGLGSTTINVTGNVYDHANASLASASNANSVTLNFGSVILNSSVASQNFTIYNRAANTSAANTANLKLTGFGEAGTPSFSTTLATFSGLAAGNGNTYSASMDTSTPGQKYKTLTLSASQLADDIVALGAGNNNNGALTINLEGRVYHHSNGHFGVTSGNHQSVIVGAAGITAGLSLTNSGAFNAALDVIDVSAGLTPATPPPTGASLIPADGAKAYTAALNTSIVGIGQTQSFDADVQDENIVGRGDAYNVVANVTLDVYDHSNAEFVGNTGTNTLNLNFGTITQGSVASLGYQIANLLATARAGLDLDAIVELSDPDTKFSTNATTFTALTNGGTSDQFLVMLDTSTLGTFTGQYVFKLSDQDLAGATAPESELLTLNVIGNVAAVPEPSSALGLLGVAGLLSHRRRRTR